MSVVCVLPELAAEQQGSARPPAGYRPLPPPPGCPDDTPTAHRAHLHGHKTAHREQGGSAYTAHGSWMTSPASSMVTVSPRSLWACQHEVGFCLCVYHCAGGGGREEEEELLDEGSFRGITVLNDCNSFVTDWTQTLSRLQEKQNKTRSKYIQTVLLVLLQSLLPSLSSRLLPWQMVAYAVKKNEKSVWKVPSHWWRSLRKKMLFGLQYPEWPLGKSGSKVEQCCPTQV